ncbi:MAG: hypothetical protein JXB25_01180 [Deltaproteobacteria bacterium]|nr:hypothetical protein [Deltaproteobacteria bacterium]
MPCLSRPALGLFCLLFLFPIYLGCSKDEPPSKSKTASVAEIGPALPESAPPVAVVKKEESREVKEEVPDFSDNGEECIGHEYVIRPGLTATLDFQAKIKKNTLPDLGEKVIDEQIIPSGKILVTIQEWGKIGVISQVESAYLDREDTATSFWGVRIPAKQAELARKKSKGGPALGEEVLFNPQTPTQMAVSFSSERDYGLILKLGPFENPRELAKLPYEKILELAGGNGRLPYGGESFPVEQISVPVTNYYATLEIKTAFPANLKTKHDDCEYCLEVLDTPLCLSLSINPSKDNRYHVFGPWEIWDCN